jgi:hypothetical protein
LVAGVIHWVVAVLEPLRSLDDYGFFAKLHACPLALIAAAQS